MAMIDYGAIAFKNGKCVSTGHFTPMKDMVGWDTPVISFEDIAASISNDGAVDFSTKLPLDLTGNYFAYIGDEDCTIAFYKTHILVLTKVAEIEGRTAYDSFRVEFNNEFSWYKYERLLCPSTDVDITYIKATHRNGYYVIKWEYKGDRYKVYFGLGVDYDCYKKWHVVNYYRTPAYIFSKIVNDLKYKIEILKFRIGK